MQACRRAPLRHTAPLRLGLGLGLGLVAALAVAAAPAIACDGPSRMADGWDIASLSDAGLDAAVICPLADAMAGSNPDNLHAVLVARDDALVFEAYGRGPDRSDGRDLGIVGHGPEQQHDLGGVTASVVALVVGAGLERRLIPSLDDKLIAFLPDLKDLATPERSAVTLRQVLTETAGFAPAAQPTAIAESGDPYRAAFGRALEAAPGSRWRHDPDTIRLLGRVVETATEEKLPDFARDALFEPLGITQFEWMKLANTDADPADGLRLRPRDMLKLGQLILNGGRWSARQIVPEAFTRDAVTGTVDAGGGRRYGLLWWTGSSKVGGRDMAWAAAEGQGGQALFLVPGLGLAVAITAGRYDDPKAGDVVRGVLERSILAAITP